MNRRPSGERGSATVWVLGLAGLLAVLGVAVVLVGLAEVARHRASTAADMAALAGATRAVLSDPAACADAARIARANSAEVDGCSVGPDAVVAVRVSVPIRLGALGLFTAHGRARAGPVTGPSRVPA